MSDSTADPARLCIHTITTKPWSLEEAVAEYTAAGVTGITIWRDVLESRDVSAAGGFIREAGLDIVSLCRGGFFPSESEEGRKRAVDENLRLIDEAEELGAPLIVLVCGAVPGQPLAESRLQIRDGIESVLPHAKKAGVRLGIEPLHPMYADTRSAINTLCQANDLCEAVGDDMIGVVVDVYHLWWDPDLEKQIERAGSQLFAHHISDWKTPTDDLLLDRGIMGEGCIPLREIRGWMEAGGFKGYNEVEIFSKKLWEQDQGEFLQEILEAYRSSS